MDVFANLSPAIQFTDKVTVNSELVFQPSDGATSVVNGTQMGKLSWRVDDDSVGRVMETAAEANLWGTNTWSSSTSPLRLGFNFRYGGSSGYVGTALSIDNGSGGVSGLTSVRTIGTVYADTEVRSMQINAGSTTSRAIASGSDLGTIGWLANDSSTGQDPKQHTRFVLRGSGDWTAGRSPAVMTLQMWRGGDTGVGGKWVPALTLNNGDGATGIRVDMAVNGSLTVNGDFSSSSQNYSGVADYTIQDDRMVVVLSGDPPTNTSAKVYLPPAGMAGVGRFITVIRAGATLDATSIWRVYPSSGNTLRYKGAYVELRGPLAPTGGPYIRAATFYQYGSGTWLLSSTTYY